ncbi:MAG TPA: hypothetical protein VLT58_16515, partial [Polyangia bacterium]|nr:hypothetical protein [Polyangia bacterium]
AALAGAVVDARVLIITADGTAGELAAIRATLQYLGTPFDVLDATHDPPLTAERLATGAHGKYQAIFLDLAVSRSAAAARSPATSGTRWRRTRRSFGRAGSRSTRRRRRRTACRTRGRSIRRRRRSR